MAKKEVRPPTIFLNTTTFGAGPPGVEPGKKIMPAFPFGQNGKNRKTGFRTHHTKLNAITGPTSLIACIEMKLTLGITLGPLVFGITAD